MCIKVPTGGGKTYIAAAGLATIFSAMPPTKTKAVVWLVPSDAILEQTLASLKNPQHDYRARINSDFSHRVAVYSKAELLCGQNFSPAVVAEQLSIFVLSYDSFRTSNKEGRKAYQENGTLLAFAQHNPDFAPLADTDETALINAIRALGPIIVVDESHHATSSLSRQMLENFNPAFVLELTATPKSDANIISYVGALALKRENMVKLPVIVYNLRSKEQLIGEAISARNRLEAEAAAQQKITGRYMRPIALLQAQPKGKDDNATFDGLKKTLIDAKIPPAHIAIKTATINELRGVDLLAPHCPIRYIITINALKEGWDCPFAYILATVANRSGVVDVEQILGRVLRLPNATPFETTTLNISYCLTSSADFGAALKRVVAGLNNAGFSEQDYFAPAGDDALPPPPQPTLNLLDLPDAPDNADDDEPMDAAAIAQYVDDHSHTGQTQQMGLFAYADDVAQQYDQRAMQQWGAPAAHPIGRPMTTRHPIVRKFVDSVRDLRLPQFVMQTDLPIFEIKTKLLTPTDLCEGFTLRGKDATIDFVSMDAQIAQVDVRNEQEAPKAWQMGGRNNEFFRRWFSSQSPQRRTAHARGVIVDLLDKHNTLNGVAEYVDTIISLLTPEQLHDLQHNPLDYAHKIEGKISDLLAAHREKNFKIWLERSTITAQPTYAFAPEISPVGAHTPTIPNSLYAKEASMNSLEEETIRRLVALGNIRWWHRNTPPTGFCINGFERAYPDFIVMTNSGNVLIIETKGDHLQNPQSERKCKIGRQWANLAGPKYRYYMTFKDKDLRWDGALRVDALLEIVQGL